MAPAAPSDTNDLLRALETGVCYWDKLHEGQSGQVYTFECERVRPVLATNQVVITSIGLVQHCNQAAIYR